MNYIITIINPHGLTTMLRICKELDIPLMLTMHAHGTASARILDVLGIASKERRVVMAVADEDKTKALIKEQRKRLYIDAPGNGITLALPVKSVGGGRTLAYLSGGQVKKKAPELNYDYELIIAIANEGHTDSVMDAARAAGAAGGTVIHAKGTGAKNAEKFFSVSLAQEKEIVLIVARSENKSAIMESILKDAGPQTPAGAIALSLPATEIAGFSMTRDAE